MGEILRELAIKYDTDKGPKDHNFTPIYETHFNKLNSNPLKLLEIGIGRGGSLKMWAEYFTKAQIYGIDKDEKRHLDGQRITTIQCDQGNINKLCQINQLHGKFNIIIDDGSHKQSHIITTFKTLFPLLANNGIYVIEDIHTSYLPQFWDCNRTIIGYLQELVDKLHHKWSKITPTDLEKTLLSIHLYNEIAFIYKK